MYLEKCTDDQQNEIYQEFNISKESLKRDVNYLMEWMEKQPHLPNVKDENFISHLLIKCKNSIEKTKKKLDTYYTIKALLPEIFTNIDPTSDEFRIAFNLGCPVPLPKLTSDGYRIYIFRCLYPENFHLLNPDNYLKVNCSTANIVLNHDCNKKIIMIYDLENIPLSLVYSMFIASQKYHWASQELFTFRVDKVHLIIQLNSTFSTVLKTIMKNFVKKKLADKLVIWSNERPDFTSMFPAEILPEEYGGTEKPLKTLHEMYYEYICGFRERLKGDENIKADLSKRTVNPCENATIKDAPDGSFRHLIID